MNTPLTVAQAAEKLGLAPSTIRHACNREKNKLPHMKFGTAIRIDPDDLQKWKESHRVA